VERRTITGEEHTALNEIENILQALREDDPELVVSARHILGRLPYETPADHPLPALIEDALTRQRTAAVRCGATFWTDAAILGKSGIPSVVFGPGGAGLHSVTEFVFEDDVMTYRDALIALAKDYCQPG
jgi:acetylornithine deacetylase